MTAHRIFTTRFASVYPLYVAKAERKQALIRGLRADQGRTAGVSTVMPRARSIR